MIRTVATIVVASALAAPTLAQDSPSFDCAAAESSAEELICRDADLARLDRLVAERYAAALAVVRGLDAGAGAAEDALRAEQRGWISGRDECWKADDLRACVEQSYLRREGDLVARWLLEEPAGVVHWACDGDPANAVVTSFFETTLPSVRFERGDAVDTGSLAPTASGSRYDGSFGRSIWIKGDAATYRDPDPDGAAFDCVVSRRD